MINPVDRTNSEYAKNMIEALERLQKNDDFNLLVTKGYFQDEVARLTSLLSSDYLIGQGKRQLIMEALTAVSYFDMYLRDVESLRPVAEDEDDTAE
jgi:hypothetical protein